MTDDVRVVTDLPFEVDRTPHTWIDLSDGTRLAARIWRPITDEPVPAILEYLPYRKGDLMADRDERLGTWFAGHGYAWIRVDIRGTGDSDGIIADEYTRQEQNDGLEVIDWIEARPWCTGSVGMIGISWGGFNGLQIAARRPPALKAVISMCSTDDRYADDVHYDGGCVLNWDALPWASIMLGMNALPPDPETVGEGWRETWLRRLDETPPFIHAWLTHQRRDDFWRQGSVCEDYAAIECPVYMVGGWADGYTNAIGRTLAGLPGTRKGLIGPWPHSFPHRADQGPRIGFLQEALRWWDRWLKGVDNGIEDEPMLRAWVQEPAGPDELSRDRPGRWVSETAWPPPSVTPSRWHLGGGSLDAQAAPAARLTHTGLQHHGLAAGTWCPYGPAADFPPDQREEDALCLTFDSAPFEEQLELLGHPRLRLTVSADRPNAFVMARLCDVSPDGTSTLLSRGALNLTHRQSHEDLAPVEPGQDYEVDIELDALGQAVAAGHRLRLALSTTYWPWLWPSPEVTTITVTTGASSWLELPVRPREAGDGPDPAFEPPETAPGLETVVEEQVPAFHIVEHDIVAGTYTMRFNQDGDNRVRNLPSGIEMWDRNRDEMTIRDGDPSSARTSCQRVYGLARGDWRVEIRTHSTMTADATDFHLSNTVEAFEGDDRVFERTWERTIPRDHV